MLLIERRIWSAQAATVTTTFDSVEPELAHSLSYILTFAGSGFSGTIDIQGRENNPDTWSSVTYQEIDKGGSVGAPTEAPLLFSGGDSRRRFLISIAPVYVRLVLAWKGGTISAWVRGSGMPITMGQPGQLLGYYVTSAEAKPLEGVSEGERLLEYDTDICYTFAGGEWRSDREATELRILRDIRTSVEKLATLVDAITDYL